MSKLLKLIILSVFLSGFIIACQPDESDDTEENTDTSVKTVPTEVPGITWRVENLEIMPDNADTSFALAAPDGHTIAYSRSKGEGSDLIYLLCSYDFRNENETCMEVTRNLSDIVSSNRIEHGAQWSPDSSRLAHTGFGLGFSENSDLSIIDLAESSRTVLIDDPGDEGRSLLRDDAQNISVENNPAWSPDGKQIAVEQVIFNISETEKYDPLLAIINIEDRTVQTIVHFMDTFPDMEQPIGVTSRIEWSPDGQKLAVVFTGNSSAFEPYLGLWIVDIDTKTMENVVANRAIVDSLELLSEQAFPESESQSNAFLVHPTQVQWLPDGQSILFVASLDYRAGPFMDRYSDVAYLYHLDSGELEALPSPSSLVEHPIHNMIIALSPGGSYVLVGGDTDLADGLGLSVNDKEITNLLWMVDLSDKSIQELGGLPRIILYEGEWGLGNTVLFGEYFFNLETE